MARIAYKKRKKYKYLLMKDHKIPMIDIKPPKDIRRNYYTLTTTGELTINKDYAWDGASRAPDTKKIMRGSLVHDVLYQAMREEDIDYKKYRKNADEIFRSICIEDGMSRAYALIVYTAVRLFGKKFAKPDLLHAP